MFISNFDKLLFSIQLIFLSASSLALSKLKALAVDKLNVGKLMISVSARLENMVGKGENACYHNVSKTLSVQGVVKPGLFGKLFSLYYTIPTFNNP